MQQDPTVFKKFKIEKKIKNLNRSDFLVQNVRLVLPVHCLQITFYAITEALIARKRFIKVKYYAI